MESGKYVLISGFNIHDNNRGTAALSYGAISFLKEKNLLTEKQILVNFRRIKNFFRAKNRGCFEEKISTADGNWTHITFNVFFLEVALYMRLGILFPFTSFGKAMRQISLVAAINGGDGFSDIYSTETFLGRLYDIGYAMRKGIPVIILPQTLGPFRDKRNLLIAKRILKYANMVYVRDDKFTDELMKMNMKYELTKDLSAFMKPQSWDIAIPKNSIGINVSGLAYSNTFRTLSGQFEQYPALIDELIRHFQKKGLTVYLIPHSYNYNNPEQSNDDIVACREAYNKLKDKQNVVFLDENLTSPKIKYVISLMSFFIGTRMHANFAAIYTGVPVFGLAYSFKFDGAFTANGLDGRKQTAKINNLLKREIPTVIEKIESVYQQYVDSKIGYENEQGL